MVWRLQDPQGNEAAKVKYDVPRWTRGPGLDIGCGPFKVWPHLLGVDNGHHWGTGGVDIAVPDASDLSMFNTDYMNCVFSSHLLEHMPDPLATLKEWWRVIKPGGYLVLYLPHKDLYPRCGTPGANPDHKNDFDNDDIIHLMEQVGDWQLLVNEVRDTDNGPGEPGNEYSLYQVYRKRPLGFGQVHEYATYNPGRTALVIRYGGVGDALQSATVLKGLKDQGYHITFMTAPVGYTVLKDNPYIDEWYVVDKGQIPDAELYPFWARLATKYNKIVNLCESIEGTLLTIPQRTNNLWPDSVRRKYLDLNYYEWIHELAEVPFVKPDVRFYPTAEEEAKARDFAAEMGGFNIMLAVAGSSRHKLYPYQDEIINQVLLDMPEARFVLVGSADDRLLEYGWEENDRVWCMSGKMALRDTLATAMHMDCVMGPETGVLNAVAMEPMRKVIYLSHSSINNLTRDWVNTVSVTPMKEMAPCYPCHKLHYGKGACPIHERTASPVCTAGCNPEEVYEGIRTAYETWEIARAAATGT